MTRKDAFKIFEFYFNAVVFVVSAGIILYLILPKYHFSDDGKIRGNLVSGTIEYLHPSQGWVPTVESKKEKINRLKKLFECEKARLLHIWEEKVKELSLEKNPCPFHRFEFHIFGGEKTKEELLEKAEEIAMKNLEITFKDLEITFHEAPF